MILTFPEFKAHRAAMPTTHSKIRDMYSAYLWGVRTRFNHIKRENIMLRPAIEKIDRERKSNDGLITAKETDKLLKYIRLLEIRIFEKYGDAPKPTLKRKLAAWLGKYQQ